jgi:ATP-dependent Clp protease ATP-binding subunit ClpC
VGPEHLLLGLIASESAWMGRIWKQLAVDATDLASRISSAAGGRGAAPLTESPQLIGLVSRAAAIAVQRRSALVRPEHLLLAIADEGQSLAATWLASVGGTADSLRKLLDLGA